MSEWQPARTITVHPLEDGMSTPSYEADARQNGKITRVREIDARDVPFAVRQYRAAGCDAKRFFLIHPDDAEAGNVACEHEILTD